MAAEKFTIYTFSGSQWAGVMHLALAEKGFTTADYDQKEVDLATAENFDPEYLKINPNGTVPSLTSPSLSSPLSESTDILRYLDSLKPNAGASLVPQNPSTKRKVQEILDLVHSDDVSTNLILFQARDKAEMQAKKASIWAPFLDNRQKRLDQEKKRNPDHPFYEPKAKENGQVHDLYQSDHGDKHDQFFEDTHKMYVTFAEGMDRLDSMLVLPYAAGDRLTEADFHVVPWLAHGMWGAGTEPSDVQNFETLEAVIQKSAPGFKVGPRIKEWWGAMARTESFKKVFPNLH